MNEYLHCWEGTGLYWASVLSRRVNYILRIMPWPWIPKLQCSGDEFTFLCYHLVSLFYILAAKHCACVCVRVCVCGNLFIMVIAV